MSYNMTDNEIIQALEGEIHLAGYVDSNYCDGVNLSLIKNALDLINRLQSEIERLKINLKAVLDERADHTEAIEEFADKLYRFFTKRENWRMMKDEWLLNGECEWLKESIYKVRQEIIENELNKDNVKEMVGED